jgi:hypothetical protein
MAEIQYSLRYELTWWQDVCRIEPDLAKWAELIDGAETFIERTPEVVPSRTELGDRVMPTAQYVPALRLKMYITFSIIRFAPDGLVSMKHVITEEDVRADLFFDYDPDFEWTGECP